MDASVLTDDVVKCLSGDGNPTADGADLCQKCIDDILDEEEARVYEERKRIGDL